MDRACFPSPDEAHDSRQPRADNRHASPSPHHCADLTRYREARKDVAVRPERMTRCQPHDLEGDVANPDPSMGALFRGRLVAVDRPRVDQRRRAPGDHHFPYLGPVEPLEHHPARLLDASPLVRKGASSPAARLYRSARSATRRRAWPHSHFPTRRAKSFRPCHRKSRSPRPLPPSAQASFEPRTENHGSELPARWRFSKRCPTIRPTPASRAQWRYSRSLEGPNRGRQLAGSSLEDHGRSGPNIPEAPTLRVRGAAA